LTTNASSTLANAGFRFAAGEGITNSMALEVAKSEIRVNAVMLGRTDTWHAAPLPRRWRNYRSWWRRFRWGGNACPKGTNA
jgi:NAD(P)-dependent dehydrogenase (short-subunit alcohol dehydrogenase family)